MWIVTYSNTVFWNTICLAHRDMAALHKEQMGYCMAGKCEDSETVDPLRRYFYYALGLGEWNQSTNHSHSHKFIYLFFYKKKCTVYNHTKNTYVIYYFFPDFKNRNIKKWFGRSNIFKLFSKVIYFSILILKNQNISKWYSFSFHENYFTFLERKKK